MLFDFFRPGDVLLPGLLVIHYLDPCGIRTYVGRSLTQAFSLR